jgi:dienelactone hydrolase family protein
VPVGHIIEPTSSNKAFNNDTVETDHTFPKESRRRAEDILEEVKATYHVQIFSGVAHGFGTRGDPDVENSRMFYKPFEIPVLLSLSLIAV